MQIGIINVHSKLTFEFYIMNTKLKLALFFAFITSIVLANNYTDSKKNTDLCPFYNYSIKGKVSFKNDTIPPKSNAELKYEKYIKDTKDYNKEIDSIKKNLVADDDKNDQLRKKRLNTSKLTQKKTADNNRETMYENTRLKISDNKSVHKINVEERRRLQLELLAANRQKKLRVIPDQVVKEREKDSSDFYKGRKDPLEKNKRFVVKNKQNKLIKEVDDNQIIKNNNQDVKNNNVTIANFETNPKKVESETPKSPINNNEIVQNAIIKSETRKELNIPVDNSDNQQLANLDENKNEILTEKNEETIDAQTKNIVVSNDDQNTIKTIKQNNNTSTVELNRENSSKLNDKPIQTKVSEKVNSVEKPVNELVAVSTPIDNSSTKNDIKVEDNKKNTSEFVFDREENFEYASVEDMLIRIDALEKIKSKFDAQHNYFLTRTASDLEDDSLEKHKSIANDTDVSDLIAVINMLDKIEEMEVAKMKMDYNLAFFKAREEFMKNPEKYKEQLIASAKKENLSADEMLRKIKHLENIKVKIENNHAYFLSRIIEEIDKDLK